MGTTEVICQSLKDNIGKTNCLGTRASEITWCPLASGCVKLNCDGASCNQGADTAMEVSLEALQGTFFLRMRPSYRKHLVLKRSSMLFLLG